MILFRSIAVFAAVVSVAAASLTLTPTANAQSAKPAGKPQYEVAAKTAWPTVKSSDSAVAKALKATDLKGAEKMVGKSGAFTGTVSETYAPKSGKLVILNFDKDYKKALTAVVKSEDFAKFPDLQALTGKKVLVTGKFVSYKNATEIELTNPAQLKLIK